MDWRQQLQEDLEYRAEFWRQQFEVYDRRRTAEEDHASRVVAATLVVAGLVLADYGRKSHPHSCWLIVALVGLFVAFTVALDARTVSWETPWWRGGICAEAAPPSDDVKSTLDAVRDHPGEVGCQLRQRAIDHWKARQHSAWLLSDAKEARLRCSLWGFIGPAAYFTARLLM